MARRGSWACLLYTSGKATWYRIAYLYTAITKLAELNSEGVRLEDVTGIFPDYLRRGNKGDYVRVLQYYLNAIGVFFTGEDQIPIDGDFGTLTEQAVRSVPVSYTHLTGNNYGYDAYWRRCAFCVFTRHRIQTDLHDPDPVELWI